MADTVDKISGDNYDNDDKSDPSDSAAKKSSDQEGVADLIGLMNSSLMLTKPSPRPRKLESLDLHGLAQYIPTCKNIVFMTGAGISTSAGIPDFRSPVTGLYANLAKYNLPFPEAVFCLDYFLKNPQPFYTLSKELMPKNYRPTISHYFQRLLIEKGHVLKVYTQNIDALETIAKIPEDKLIAAHGSFEKGHCFNCKSEYTLEWMKQKLEGTEFMKCEQTECLDDEDVDDIFKIVKPDITFFGEQLPDLFMNNYETDLSNADLLIVMGTSLKVQPFGLLSQLVDDDCPRLLINRELVGSFTESVSNPESNYRDVFLEGNCDDGCLELAKKLGYYDELIELMKSNKKIIQT